MKRDRRMCARLATLFLLVLLAGAAHGQDCAALASGYLRWVGEKPGQTEGSRTVGVKMAVVKIRERNPDRYPWGHGSYSEGRLGWHGDDMTGRLRTLFSDRRSSDGHRFAPDKSDLKDVTVFADGRVRVVLVSWGSATFFLEDVKCFRDGFIAGVMREANGVSLVSLALRREIMHPATDGFRGWP